MNPFWIYINHSYNCNKRWLIVVVLLMLPGTLVGDLFWKGLWYLLLTALQSGFFSDSRLHVLIQIGKNISTGICRWKSCCIFLTQDILLFYLRLIRTLFLAKCTLILRAVPIAITYPITVVFVKLLNIKIVTQHFFIWSF